jgi:hypothetical protein
MMELLTWMMATKLGSIFLSMVCLKGSSWHSHLGTSTTRQNCTVKGWNLYFVFCQAPKRNGAEFSRKSIISLTKMINLHWSFSICSVTNQMKQHILLFLILGVTRSLKIKLMKSKEISQLRLLRWTYTFIEKLSIILSKVGKWRWWRSHQKMGSLMNENRYLKAMTTKAFSQRQLKMQIDVRLDLSKKSQLSCLLLGSILVRHLDLMF